MTEAFALPCFAWFPAVDMLNSTTYFAMLATYQEGLIADTITFWLRHGLDREHEVLCTAMRRDCSAVDADKALWLQG